GIPHRAARGRRSMTKPTKIHIPSPLRPYADHQAVIEVEGATVGDALAALVARHGELGKHLFDERGELRRFVNVYRNDQDIRHLERERTPLADGDTVSIVPSIAGGSPGAPAWATGADGRPALSPDELQRYGRHLILPEVGLDGQRKIKAASVLIVGA